MPQPPGETDHPFTLGIHAGIGHGIPFGDRMRMIRDAGFAATSLWWEEKRPEARRLRHLAPDIVRSAGLHLDNVHVPYTWSGDLWRADAGDRQAAVNRHLAWVDDCRRHAVPIMVMHVALGTATPRPGPAGIDSLRHIVAAAEDAGVTIAIENTRSPRHIDALLREIPSARLGLCYDASHDRLYSPEPFKLLEDWGHRLIATHLSDTDGRRDRHWLPGDGVIDLDTLAKCMPSQSYTGSYLLEVTPSDSDEPPRQFLGRAYRAVQSFAQRLRAPIHVSRPQTARSHP